MKEMAVIIDTPKALTNLLTNTCVCLRSIEEGKMAHPPKYPLL
jgi:hypothetical protein